MIKKLAENFLSTSELIETLKNENIIKDDDLQLNVFFDDFGKSKVYKFCWWCQILSFTIQNKDCSRKFSFKDFHELFPDKYYLNIGKQCNKDMQSLPLTIQIHKLMISLNKTNYKNNYKDFSFYPIKLYSGPNLPNLKKLRDENSKAMIDKANELAASFIDEEYLSE